MYHFQRVSRNMIMTILMCILICTVVNSQSWKQELITFDTDKKYLLQEVLDIIESQGNLTLSYSSGLLDINDSIYVTNEEYSIEHVISLIEKKYAVESIYKTRRKILLYRNLGQNSPFVSHPIYGYLRDSETKSMIPSGYIYFKGGETYSDENGYFEIGANILMDTILNIDVVGYESKEVKIKEASPINIDLTHVNILDTFFVVASETDYIDKYIPPQGKLLEANNISSYGSLTGEPDLITSIRHYSAFDIGGEGRHGLSIRGGNSDQNLVLIDDIPVFEFSHIGGTRSIFLPDAIQSATFTSSGISSTYEGKLSSVLDVKLKSPNLNKTEAFGNIGLDAMSVTVSTPIITDKLGILIGGRLRPFRLVDQSIITSILDYEKVKLNYNDFLVKSTYTINNNHQVSGLLYKGQDIFSYENVDQVNSNFSNIFNEIGWGNLLYGISYRGIISNRITLTSYVNQSNYHFNSRGAFSSSAILSDQSYDVYSSSQNSVQTVKSEIDYYHTSKGKTTIGLRYAKYRFSPNIYQSTIYKDPNITNLSLSERQFEQPELSVYAQSYLPVNEQVLIVAGMKYLELSFENQVFRTIEPRFALHLKGQNRIKAQLDFTVIHQPIHVLINPGLGLPSDLWYPSNSVVKPQRSDQIGASVHFDMDHGQSLGIAFYNKTYQNLIDYADPYDLLVNLIDPSQIVQYGATKLDIEDLIIQGNGNARGAELSYRIQSPKFIGWINYGLNYSTRIFEEINEGTAFPSRFDRRHSVSTSLSYTINKQSNIIIQWAYGSGYPFTLDTETFTNPQDSSQIILQSDRNNFRLRDFHHLDIRYSWHKKLEHVNMQLSGGLYNLYNRRNPFYVYVRNVPGESRKELVNVSLFPILPSLKVQVEF